MITATTLEALRDGHPGGDDLVGFILESSREIAIGYTEPRVIEAALLELHGDRVVQLVERLKSKAPPGTFFALVLERWQRHPARRGLA